MQQTMERIAHILEDELNIYNKLVEISRKLTDVILEGEIGQLDEVLSVQQTMIMTLGKLENDRSAAMDELWRDDLVITDLIENTEGELAHRLEKVLEDLLEVIEEQKRLNAINNKLIQTNLEYVEFTLSTLDGGGPKNIFDQKA